MLLFADSARNALAVQQKIWYVNEDVKQGQSTEARPVWQHQEPGKEPEESDLPQGGGCLPDGCGHWAASRPEPFVGQQDQLLGTTSVERQHYRDPQFLWSLSQPVRVPFFNRGWLIIELIDEDKFE